MYDDVALVRACKGLYTVWRYSESASWELQGCALTFIAVLVTNKIYIQVRLPIGFFFFFVFHFCLPLIWLYVVPEVTDKLKYITKEKLWVI